jgi:hypothetical protein
MKNAPEVRSTRSPTNHSETVDNSNRTTHMRLLPSRTFQINHNFSMTRLSPRCLFQTQPLDYCLKNWTPVQTRTIRSLSYAAWQSWVKFGARE